MQLLQGGEQLFPDLIAAINTSQVEVRLETYIFYFDQQGEAVASALAAAALRGVAVHVVMDGIGTPSLPSIWRQRFDDAGVQWHRFSPLGRLGLLLPIRWRRLHRKLCVVDSSVAWCGGINVIGDLSDPNHGPLASPRFDFAVQIRGPLVADIHHTMEQFWSRLQATHQLERLKWTAARKAWATLRAPKTFAGSQPGIAPSAGSAHAALVLRDNVRNRSRIEQAYRRAIGNAQHEVILANAYFLPSGKLRRALVHAAKRGVRVRLLLQGRYEYFMQYHAARPVYGALLAAGVEIHEYTHSFLHAKVAVVDGQWATVGSSNLDPLSLLLAREGNVVVQDATFALALKERLEVAMAEHGRVLDPVTYAGRPLYQRLLDGVAYSLMRAMLFLTGRRY